ncbi:DNA gyrase inhibitor YacG, partial [Pseudomonas syringae pv. tagetis]
SPWARRWASPRRQFCSERCTLRALGSLSYEEPAIPVSPDAED